MTLELHASPQEVMRAVEALREFAKAKHIPEETIFRLALMLEECASNIVNHALKHDARQKFQVLIELNLETFVIELRDRGPAFDPTQAAERNPQAADVDLPGGWGIQLVRRYTDEIHYRREGEENVLRLTKCLRPISAAARISHQTKHSKPK